MKNRFLLTLFALFSVAGAYSSTIDNLIANINEMTLQSKADTRSLAEEFISVSDHGKYNDVMILELYVAVTISDAEAEGYLNTLQPDGSWSDIDYKDTKPSRWDPALHLTRIQSLAKVYKSPESKYYNSPVVLAALHKSLNFWFDAGLVCKNWWYNEIGGPKMLGPAMLLIKDELTPQEKQRGEAVMAKATFRGTGQNKVWLSGNILMRALLTDNIALVEQARDSIVSELYVSTAEGLQPDNSFHQHGAQMQFGNYGLAYAGTMSYWARVLKGTPLAVSPDQLAYLRNYILEGLRWTVWRGYMDVNACGRQVFKDAQRGKALSVAVTAINMIKVDPDYASEYQQFIYRNLIDPKSPNFLWGHKCFPRSDFTIHRTGFWYASVRMSSNRLKSYEMTNHENLQGVYASDGVMILMLSGQEYNNIYPVWNWKRLPGSTVADNGKPIEYSNPGKPINLTDFVGQVTDGQQGVAAMEIAKDGLAARKSYFFIDNLIVCTGSGIASAESLPIFTTLNQSLLNGEVTYSEKNKMKILAPEQLVLSSNIQWVNHDGVGYYFLQQDNVTLGNKTQYGDWSSIAQFYSNMPDSAKVFSLVINHSKMSILSSYAYCVLPNYSSDWTAQFAKKPKVKLLFNTQACHAVSNLSGSMSEYVFYEPCVVNLSDGTQISAQTTGIVMIGQGKDEVKITVSDPTQKLSEIKLAIKGHLLGDNASYNAQNNETAITIPLPTEDGLRGGSVSTVFTKSGNK